MKLRDVQLAIGNPSYMVGTQNLPAQLSAYRTDIGRIHHLELTGSILTWSFNTLWAAALNLKEEAGLTHFLLWHSDIRPLGQDWLKTMIEEMFASEADVLSAIVPIKDRRGLTSTALDTDPWQPVRITQHQAHHELPVSWTAPNLLLNTGLMLVDFTKPWVYDVCFHMHDRIVRNPEGKWTAHVIPEDWDFSRQCHRLGLKLVATRCVTVEHFGQGCWNSSQIWGEKFDETNTPLAARPESNRPDASANDTVETPIGSAQCDPFRSASGEPILTEAFVDYG